MPVMKIYDISMPLSADTPVFPGDPPVIREPFLELSKGDEANVSRLVLSTHSGTHIDAPRHMDDRGVTVDHISLPLLIGRALVVEMTGTRLISRKELERFPVKGEDRLLLKTANSKLWGLPEFSENYACLTEDGADYLAGIGIGLVGIDYLSIEPPDSSSVHRKLMQHGIVILEGLNLSEVPAGIYQLICLPLRVKDGDGAPARAILMQKQGGEHRGGLDVHTTKWPLA
jgi:arylformamidase